MPGVALTGAMNDWPPVSLRNIWMLARLLVNDRVEK